MLQRVSSSTSSGARSFSSSDGTFCLAVDGDVGVIAGVDVFLGLLFSQWLWSTSRSSRARPSAFTEWICITCFSKAGRSLKPSWHRGQIKSWLGSSFTSIFSSESCVCAICKCCFNSSFEVGWYVHNGHTTSSGSFSGSWSGSWSLSGSCFTSLSHSLPSCRS
ncbi:GSCOCG00003035001-RA-CDS [Cotesia congregata]|nr:GSCOCG00003035001-RA-CDS [Cotesia congregata]